MMINKCRFLSLLSVLALGAVAPSPASANVLCKNMDAKQIHLRAASYTLFGEFDTPWVTFQSAATPADCHRCLRAYDAQLALLGTAIPAIASPRSRE